MLRRLGIVSLLSISLLGVASPVLGHVDLVASDPTDEAVTTEAVSLVTLEFTQAIPLTDELVRLFDSDQNIVEIEVHQPSPTTVIVEPFEELANGRYVVVWSSTSDDGHEQSGFFSFSVDATPVVSTDQSGGTTVPPLPAETVDASPTTLAPPEPEATPSPNPEEVADQALSTGPIDVLLDDPADSDASDWISLIGRWATMSGALIAIGAFAFAATSLIGTQAEVRVAYRWVRRGGILVLVGTVLELVGAMSATSPSLVGGISPTNLMDVMASPFGIAVILRLAGGLAILQDPRLVAVSTGTPIADAGRSTSTQHLPMSGERGSTATLPSATYRLEIQHEWVTLIGLAVIAVSFLFDGHTVTAQPGVIAKASSLIHVIAGGVWLGGLVVMVDTLTRRWRSAVPLDAAALAIRFSRVATAALVAVAIAGLALTWSIASSAGDLVSTDWGRWLLLKIALVSVAAALGAYNHFKVVPQLSLSSADPGASTRFYRVVSVEVGVLIVVVGVAAVLVGLAL